MNKAVIRKGLFETASSSEDSFSVYQDMKLFVVPADIYTKFKNGDVYMKLDNMNPSYTEDENVVIADNEKQLIGSKIVVEGYKSYPFIYVPRWSGDFLYYLNNFFTNYDAYRYTVNRYYNDVSFFEYENYDEVIFGFYGYVEE